MKNFSSAFDLSALAVVVIIIVVSVSIWIWRVFVTETISLIPIKVLSRRSPFIGKWLTWLAGPYKHQYTKYQIYGSKHENES